MPSDPRDYRIDLSSAAGAATPAAAAPATSAARPFISVHFACCNVYLRIYRSANGTEYRGRCPKCGKAVHFAVGEGGTDSRVFRVE